ncbi:1-phosphofructokinase [Sphingomonas sp. NFR15]|uniref:1-phosphofructokinase n=1 Tax=Sphingomonas sp. NFR15 TaxID=1566282 RepID=UPI00088AB6D7|nr:1-phosphofructokinase [Sphingomonas sp. NFR15]SDA11629.1 1-phosphofructokinase [Sphingomonas sp. NFR15]
MRIHTVTLNPAIDQTVTLDRLVPGEVHRATAVRQNAGGKGVNVASCLADWNLDVVAHGLLGRDNAAPFDQLFAQKAIDDRFVRVAGSTRVNLKLVDRVGTTDINLTGIAVDESQVDMVVATLSAAVQRGDLVILSGSVPPGCSSGIYAMLVRQLRGTGCRVLLDTSGLPLERALEAEVLPHVVKPNRDELAAWVGHPFADRAALIDTARGLLDRGVELVVVSMGAEGALFLSADGTVATQLVLGDVTSTVGAGDAMVAGIAAALHENAEPERLARLATAFAGGKLGMAGPNLPARGAIEALAADVSVSRLEIA